MEWITKVDPNMQWKIEQLFSNFSWRLENLYFIVDENGDTIPFKPNAIQREILNGRSDFRDIILKYRQGWVSTLFIILMLDEVLFGWTNINNVFITHRQDLLDVFFQKARFTYENIPDEYKALLPRPSTDNANELAFATTQSGKLLNNRLKIWLDVRWQTPTRLHISEFAFIDAEKQIRLKLAIDQFRKTKITIETTANGVWNVFYNACMTAKNQKWSYKLLFYPWYIEERNVKPLEKWESFIMDDYEKQLQKNYKLNEEQLNWRREKIHDANALWEDWFKLFEQENPTTIEWAFVSSGTTVFDPGAKYNIKQPIKMVEWWKLYQKPQDQLMIWVDMAEWWVKGDFSCISVRNINKEIVATYKAKVNEEILAKKLDFLFKYDDLWGNYVGNVLPENNIGLAFINECKKYDWFNERMLVERKNDKMMWEDNQIFKYWFRTTLKSKDLIIRQYRWALYKSDIDITDEIYSEILTYVYDKNNRPNAIAPNHDDMLMADMICYHWLLTEPNLLEYDEKYELPDERLESLRNKDILNVNLRNNNEDQQETENLLDWYAREDYF